MTLEAGSAPEREFHQLIADYAAGRVSWDEVLAFVNKTEKPSPASNTPATEPIDPGPR